MAHGAGAKLLVYLSKLIFLINLTENRVNCKEFLIIKKYINIFFIRTICSQTWFSEKY